MNRMKRFLIGAGAAATIGSTVFVMSAQAAPQRPVPSQPAIIKYQFTYNRSGILIGVTIQDAGRHITQFPCSRPAVSGNGNYSVSCDR